MCRMNFISENIFGGRDQNLGGGLGQKPSQNF